MDAHRKQHEAWDPQYKFASRVSDVLEAVAKYHFKVAIDEATGDRWADLMGLMREIDTASDDFTSHDQILDELKSFAQFRDRYPHITPEQLGPELFDKLIDTTISILRMGREMAATQNADRFLGLRQHEARLTAHLFGITATEAVRDQDAFNDAFMPALTRVTIAANFFDSSRDIVKDHYRDHIVGVEPTLRLRAKLTGLTAAGIKEDYRAFLHPAIWGPYSRLIAIGIYSHHKKNQMRRRLTK